MHLVSTSAQSVRIGESEFRFTSDQCIHFEDSYKHTTKEFKKLSQWAGFHSVDLRVDADELFDVHLFCAQFNQHRKL